MTHNPKPSHHMSNRLEAVLWQGDVAANRSGSLVLIDVVTADRSRWMNSEVYSVILSTQIQVNAAKLTGWCFTIPMDNNPEHTVKATESFLSQRAGMKMEYPSRAQSVGCFSGFSLTKDKTEGRPTKRST